MVWSSRLNLLCSSLDANELEASEKDLLLVLVLAPSIVNVTSDFKDRPNFLFLNANN